MDDYRTPSIWKSILSWICSFILKMTKDAAQVHEDGPNMQHKKKGNSNLSKIIWRSTISSQFDYQRWRSTNICVNFADQQLIGALIGAKNSLFIVPISPNQPFGPFCCCCSPFLSRCSSVAFLFSSTLFSFRCWTSSRYSLTAGPNEGCYATSRSLSSHPSFLCLFFYVLIMLRMMVQP